MITSTDPARLNALICPVTDNDELTAFGVGELLGVQFKLAAVGRGEASAG
jgi:hypothetical protein